MIAARLVRHARHRAGLSQRALGRAAGIPQSTVARIELDKLSPRADTLERLLKAAGQTLSTEDALGVGVDRGQIRQFLRMTPAQRVQRLTSDARTLRALDRAVLHGR